MIQSDAAPASTRLFAIEHFLSRSVPDEAAQREFLQLFTLEDKCMRVCMCVFVVNK